MSTLLVDGINDADGGGPKATLPTTGGSAFTLGPNWGALEFVSTASITAVANIEVNDMAAGYDYLIQIENFAPTTDSGVLWARLADDNVPTYLSGASDYEWGGNWTNSGGGDSEIEFAPAMGNDAGNASTVMITIINPGQTGENVQLRWEMAYFNASANFNQTVGGASFTHDTSSVEDIQFGWSTSYGAHTFKAQGDITVWRRRRS